MRPSEETGEEFIFTAWYAGFRRKHVVLPRGVNQENFNGDQVCRC